jgi:predicted ATPase/class 3 adenylate cyclase
MPSALPSGTVTFLFTDIEGSTKLLQHLGDTYATVLAEHQSLLRQAFAEHGGIEIDTAGDGFFVAFPTAPAAVAAAAAATRALVAHTWPVGGALHVRMGLHTGAPQLVGDHYVGLDVHRAARIAAAGHGGQILLSGSTRVLAAQNLPEEATLRELGTYRLKDLQVPEPITQLVLAGLPSEFPPLKTLDRRAHNLPIQPTGLLGREDQLAALSALLGRAEVRLVTLTGAGGIGKTRLALQVAAEVLDDFPDGVWFVRLSRLTDPNLVLSTIADTLSVHEIVGQPIARTLSEHLREKQLFLLLDNFEQVVAAAPEVGMLLAQCPGLKVLVTSRVPLHLRGERDYALVPLPLPEPGVLPPPERLTQYAAVALFVEQASAARSDFRVTAANAPTIAEICARLDGLPLAIELAASRVKLLSPEVLLARLSRQLQLLTGGPRDLEARQQTMRATIAWSVELLHPEEQVLFRRLSVFVGGGTLETTQEVCLDPDEVKPLKLDVLDGLGALVDQSLVQRREEDGSELRFGMLHVIREYAQEQLLASGEADALQHAYTRYYLALAERLGPRLGGLDDLKSRSQLAREYNNFRTAMDWSIEHQAAELAVRLWVALQNYWTMSGHWVEQGQWLAQTLPLSDEVSPPLRARLLSLAGYFTSLQGNYEAAGRYLEESQALLRAGDDPAGLGRVLRELARLDLQRGDFAHAEQLYAESFQLFQEAGDRTGVLETLRGQTSLPYYRGDYPAVRKLFEEARALAEDLGDIHDLADCKANLGWLAVLEGHEDNAVLLLNDALVAQRQLNDTNCSAVSLGFLGLMALESGDFVGAQARLAESLALYTKIAKQGGIAEIQINMGMVYFAIGKVEEAEAAYRAGLRILQRLERGLAKIQRITAGLEGVAEVALVRGNPERAARLLGTATQALASVGAVPLPLPPRLRAKQEQIAAHGRQALGEAAWGEAFAAGEAMSLEEALAEVLPTRS